MIIKSTWHGDFEADVERAIDLEAGPVVRYSTMVGGDLVHVTARDTPDGHEQAANLLAEHMRAKGAWPSP